MKNRGERCGGVSIAMTGVKTRYATTHASSISFSSVIRRNIVLVSKEYTGASKTTLTLKIAVLNLRLSRSHQPLRLKRAAKSQGEISTG